MSLEVFAFAEDEKSEAGWRGTKRGWEKEVERN